MPIRLPPATDPLAPNGAGDKVALTLFIPLDWKRAAFQLADSLDISPARLLREAMCDLLSSETRRLPRQSPICAPYQSCRKYPVKLNRRAHRRIHVAAAERGVNAATLMRYALHARLRQTDIAPAVSPCPGWVKKHGGLPPVASEGETGDPGGKPGAGS